MRIIHLKTVGSWLIPKNQNPFRASRHRRPEDRGTEMPLRKRIAFVEAGRILGGRLFCDCNRNENMKPGHALRVKTHLEHNHFSLLTLHLGIGNTTESGASNGQTKSKWDGALL
jgi:hypothetical protein